MKKQFLFNAKLAEICGAFLGDGWIQSRPLALYITGDLHEDRQYYDNFLGPLFSETMCPLLPQEFRYWQVYGIRCCDRRLIANCIGAGVVPGKKAYTVEIPDWIMNSENRKVWIGVLRGLFDTDGCFYCDLSRSSPDIWRRKYHCRPEIHISSCSKQLLLQMQSLLSRLGINSKCTRKESAGFRFGRNCKASYHLRIRKLDQVIKWFDIIGSNNPRHVTKYSIWKKFGFVPPRTGFAARVAILNGEIDPYARYS
jgi:hypothetical protein